MGSTRELLSRSCAATLGIAGVALASSAVAAEVPLEREAPFAAWCVAPVCYAPGAHTPFAKAPALVPDDADRGLLEQKARQALTESLEAVARKGLGPAYHRGLADAAEALAATVAGDGTRLAKVGGLGAAAVRAGLVARLASTLPADPACVAPARVDAIYEGLGVSVALGPLAFPKKTGRVEASCLATARRAARTVDEAALRALAPAPVRRAVAGAAKALGEAEAACAAADAEIARMPTVGAIGARVRAARARAASVGDAACGRALGAVGSLPVEPFDALAGLGLGAADVGAVAAALGDASADGDAILARVAAGAATVEDVRVLVAALLASLPPADAAPALAKAIAFLPEAVVVVDGTPTVDPKALLEALARTYGGGLAGTPWVFELNGGIPRVDFSAAKVVADLGVGYTTKSFGVVARGFIDTYDLNESLGHSDYLHTGGELDGYWMSGAFASALRLELRLSGGFEYYDTTSYPKDKPTSAYNDYDSRIGRGTLLVGLRVGAPLDRFSMSLLGGGGAQYEDPDTTQIDGSHQVKFTSDQTVSAHANGRLGARVRIVPGIFGARLRSELRYFRRTRDELALASGQVTTTFGVVRQVESRSRLFLDADVASFAGFVPAVFGGVDVISMGGADAATSAVPILGVGIVRNTW